MVRTMDDHEIDRALEPLRELLAGRRAVSFDKDITFKTKNENQVEVKLMASFNFEDLKQKITKTAGAIADKTAAIAKDVAGKSTDAAKNVAGKAQNAGRKAKLNVEIASARSALKDKYTELGKLYYEKYAGHTDPDFAETAAAIEADLDVIEAKQAEIEALSEQEEPETEVTAEEAETGTETDHVVDEIEETVEHEADMAAEAADEAASEAKKEFDAAVDAINNKQE